MNVALSTTLVALLLLAGCAAPTAKPPVNCPVGKICVLCIGVTDQHPPIER